MLVHRPAMSTVAPLPSVTVIIPCFNQARYLRSAIESVHTQTHQPEEVIVVDDGSTDDTAAVAELMGARVLRQTNQGVSATRNAGLAQAQGELLVFLDADDVLLPTALEREAAALAERPDTAAVVTRCEAMDEGGNPIPVVHHPIDPANLYRDWLARNFVWTPGAAMFRRDALRAIGGFARDLGPAADFAIYLRLARDGRMVLIDGAAVRYRQHAASMSRDPVLMLRVTTKALAREASAGPLWVRQEVWRARRTWCSWYGEQIVEDVRNRWRDGTWTARDLLAVLTLLRRCPGTVAEHAARKARQWIGAVLKAPSAARKASR
jgi:glycosyltransferase involved in cell wall biosynthesis